MVRAPILWAGEEVDDCDSDAQQSIDRRRWLRRTQMVEPRQMSSPTRAKIRCAVYTRKSSEEGLEQEFNSLDAQREACEAFVTSQKHEGVRGQHIASLMCSSTRACSQSAERFSPSISHLTTQLGSRAIVTPTARRTTSWKTVASSGATAR